MCTLPPYPLSTNPPTNNFYKNLSRSPPLNWTFPTIPSFPPAPWRPLLLARCAGWNFGNGVGGVRLVLRLVGSWLEPPWRWCESYFCWKACKSLHMYTPSLNHCVFFMCAHTSTFTHTYIHMYAYLLAQDILYMSNRLLEDTYTFHIFL